MRCIGLAALAVICACQNQYLQAAGTFATAASDGSTTISGAVHYNHRVCAERAHTNYLMLRLEGHNTESAANTELYWGQSTSIEIGNQTWASYCASFDASDQLFDDALTAVAGYAKALGNVAGSDYTGTDIANLGSDANALVASFGSNASTAATALAPLAAPIGQLVGALEQSAADKDVAKIVSKTHAAVQLLLTTMSTYVVAVQAEEKQWEIETARLLDTLDARLTLDKKPVGTVELIAFVNFAVRKEREQRSVRTALHAISSALSDLTSAEQALFTANGDKSSPSLATVIGYATQVLNALAALHTAMNGDAS